MNIFQRLKRFAAINFPSLKSQNDRIVSFWEKGGADYDYFQSADQKEWVDVFWSSSSLFLPLFQKLDLRCTLEIACGTGRHAGQVANKFEKLYLLDSSEAALEEAKKRFANHNNVTYILNKGGKGIPSNVVFNGSLTSVFSYDAMVHFEKETVFSYVDDSFRCLQRGGYALLHHSNYDKNPGGNFAKNPGWRNYMTQELFLNHAQQGGFKVVDSKIFDFSCPGSDCVTLLQKPH